MAQKLSDLDIVYTVKDGDDNEELRYSLRSLKNIPHRKVYIVGYKPSWVKNVTYIPNGQPSGSKIANTNKNWQKVAWNKNISSKFILFNDDFFVMEKITKLPFYRSGTNREFQAFYEENHPDAYYTRVIENTTKRLTELGIENAKSYELHLPTIISRQAIRIALAQHYQFAPINIRTVALNLMEVDSEKIEDVKYYDEKEHMSNPTKPLEELTFISTIESIWNTEVGQFIRDKFKKKGDYER